MLVPTRLGPSPIHGVGIFAAAPIQSGAVVWEFTAGWDLTKSRVDVEALLPVARNHALRIGYLSRSTGAFIYCCDHAGFFNHSESPNVAPVASPRREGEDPCCALRDIAEGEELTVDYRSFDADPSDVYPS